MFKRYRPIGLSISSNETGLKDHYHLIYSAMKTNFRSEKPRKN